MARRPSAPARARSRGRRGACAAPGGLREAGCAWPGRRGTPRCLGASAASGERSGDSWGGGAQPGPARQVLMPGAPGAHLCLVQAQAWVLRDHLCPRALSCLSAGLPPPAALGTGRALLPGWLHAYPACGCLAGVGRTAESESINAPQKAMAIGSSQTVAGPFPGLGLFRDGPCASPSNVGYYMALYTVEAGTRNHFLSVLEHLPSSHSMCCFVCNPHREIFFH